MPPRLSSTRSGCRSCIATFEVPGKLYQHCCDELHAAGAVAKAKRVPIRSLLRTAVVIIQYTSCQTHNFATASSNLSRRSGFNRCLCPISDGRTKPSIAKPSRPEKKAQFVAWYALRNCWITRAPCDGWKKKYSKHMQMRALSSERLSSLHGACRYHSVSPLCHAITAAGVYLSTAPRRCNVRLLT